MRAFFKLIRIENILFVIVTQLLVSYALIAPIFNSYGVERYLPLWVQLALLIGTALITMGGYIINDYFDVRIDEINKPHKVVIGRAVKRNKALLWHQILTGIGVFCGLLVAWQVWSITVAMIFIFVPGLLWFYSTTYKRQFLIGNLIVAAITGFVPMIVAIVENDFLVSKLGREMLQTGIVREVYLWVGVFSLLAFACNFIREMVKDMQDEKGDRELECRTLPIVLGLKWSKLIVILLALMEMVGVLYFVNRYLSIPETVVIRYYMYYAVLGPLLFFIFTIIRAKIDKDFKISQYIMKVIMLLGLVFPVLFAYALK